MPEDAQPIVSPQPEPSPSGDRRDFLKKAACGVLGGACVLAPTAAAVGGLLDPLVRTPQSGAFLSPSSLDLLPVGGPPRRFEVIDARHSAWTKYPRSPIGSVYLHRTGEH